jgi:selenide, water dikinase
MQGFVTGASGRDWAGYGAEVDLPTAFAAEDKALLSDPQTSGGLLVACDPAALAETLAVSPPPRLRCRGRHRPGAAPRPRRAARAALSLHDARRRRPAPRIEGLANYWTIDQ